ncbi:hypothetical protein JNB63_17625 [Microbacterium trichothecenolyticum]|uniref:hypothetical protein n=1 Tax=Microbacterium trichothecenolyticum TaxID=69370 RepID=UPI001C6E6479|nr:hypothetical protein [Microbacterium trichothecenolyticum]MBW9121921.1 hypothetical protein [Microbacterium trichothecenolyticum]
MKQRSLDEVLSGSAPTFTPSVATSAALDALVTDTRTATPDRKRTRRRAVWVVPGVALALGALTAGALVVDAVTRVEEPIAIEYTTDTGITISCTATVESSAFTGNMVAVTDYYQSDGFTGTGVGQRIYEYALVLAGDKIGTPEDLPASVAWLPDENFVPYDDRLALGDAMLSFLVGDVMLELGIYDGGQAGMSSDCTGQLH